MRIVGMGSSAGGLDALRQFFSGVQSDCQHAFVVVQHQEAEKPSLLADLLQPDCALPVCTISHDTEIHGGHVYLAPPGHVVSLHHNRFQLHATNLQQPLPHLIDKFFQSLADEMDERAVGVILSGTGNDGLQGMAALKEHAALTAVQAPASARYAELPERIIQSDLADIIGEPAELAARLEEVFAQLTKTAKTDLRAQDPDGCLLASIVETLRIHTGNDFSSYKPQTLYRRIERRVGITRMETLKKYAQWIQGHAEESRILLKELLIGVTHFFRDRDVWERVAQQVFPELLAQHATGENLRAWVTGCASGEEAYTLAIVFQEFIAQHGHTSGSLQIFATDLNPRAIETARRGFYPPAIAEHIPHELLERYFLPETDGYRVIKKIRDMVVFATHNLLVDPPFGKLDLLTCRNLLIYLTPDVHEVLLERFHYSMNPGAFLLLGSSESIGNATHFFTPAAGEIPLYRWLDCLLPERKFPFVMQHGDHQRSSAAVPEAKKKSPAMDFKAITERFILGKFAPTAILTNENGDVLHMSGHPDRYLQLHEGHPHFNIHTLARVALRPALAEAFWGAQQRGDAVRVLANAGASEDELLRGSEITVSPVSHSGAQGGLMMILFSPPSAGLILPTTKDDEQQSRQNARVMSLEEMLRQTRAALQSTREEMQTSREELTSTNEELQSTNEELTTSAEELRTMNEELVRARAESEQALTRYANLFDSAPVGYFILDKNGVILQANRAAAVLLDMEQENIAGSRIVMHVTEADRQTFRSFLENAFQSTQEQYCEAGFWRENGEHRQVRLSASVAAADKHCRVVANDITEARKAITALQNSEETYRLFFEKSNDALLIIDESQASGFSSGNQSAREMFRLKEDQDFSTITIAELSTEYQPDGRLSTEKAAEMLANAQARGSQFLEWRHRRLDGTEFISEVMLTALVIRGKNVIQASLRDITARKQAEDQLEIAATVYRCSSEAMMVTDADHRIIAINNAFTRVTGYEEHEIVGKHPREILANPDDAELDHEIMHALETIGHWQGELRRRRKDGQVYTEWMSINTTWRPDGSIHRRIALFSDITEKKKNEELIWQQANFDQLTGLPNRRMFNERLAQEIKRSNRDGRGFALLFIDLDRFKEVNDTLGHDIGDELLREASERLRHNLREADFVGRLGGDEFAIILEEANSVAGINQVCQKILASLGQPYLLGNESVYISASIGVSLFPEDCGRMEELLKNADQAMYAAKHQGRNRFIYFTPAMQEAAQRRMRLANDLRSALEAQQFSLHYQPIVSLRDGSIHKAEALLRWQHPLDGAISPAQFIPVAEETGAIVDIGNWVFHEAVRQLELWRQTLASDFQISINKSPVQFREEREDGSHHWIAHLQALNMPGQAIVVEITEGTLMEAGLINLMHFQAFRDAGIQVALDDFGTGYSSLAYLKKFDIDYLKIDQSFTRNLEAGSDDMALCEAIIMMAHKLQLKVIAEGIETEEQRDLLVAAGCDYGQGYLFARPLPADEFELLLKNRRRIDPD